MAGNYLKYSAEESSFGRKTADDLPVDSHMTLALCAPRLTFISHGISRNAAMLTGWIIRAASSSPIRRSAGLPTARSKRALGRSDDYTSEKMPAVNVDLLNGALTGASTMAVAPMAQNACSTSSAGPKRSGVTPRNRTRPQRRSSINARSLRRRNSAGAGCKIGVGVGNQVLQQPGGHRASNSAALAGILTPENCMKPREHPSGRGPLEFRSGRSDYRVRSH